MFKVSLAQSKKAAAPLSPLRQKRPTPRGLAHRNSHIPHPLLINPSHQARLPDTADFLPSPHRHRRRSSLVVAGFFLKKKFRKKNKVYLHSSQPADPADPLRSPAAHSSPLSFQQGFFFLAAITRQSTQLSRNHGTCSRRMLHPHAPLLALLSCTVVRC